MALLIGAALMLTAVFGAVTILGHVLGLTPSLGQIDHEHNGWIARHYVHVVWGYVLVVVLIVGLLALALWTLVVIGRRRHEERVIAGWLGWLALFVVAVLVLPIGPRAHPIGNVPATVGLRAERASALIAKAHLGAKFAADPAVPNACRVTRQRPRAKADVPEFSDIHLRCKVRPPRVIGESMNRAESRVKAVGLVVAISGDGPLSIHCTVVRQSLIAPVAPNRVMRLRVLCQHRHPPPASQSTTTTTTPAPFDGDPYPGQDCAEIGHSFLVVPSSDPEHDADGDGVACEAYPG